MSANVATTTCKECPAPITQSGHGARKMFCATCIARRRAQRAATWYAALSLEDLAAYAQAARDRRAALSPEQRAAKTQAQREYHAALSPEEREARAQARRGRATVRTPEQREARRDHWLQRKYGLDIAGFDALLATQDGHCAICGTDEPNGNGWHVDHDHETGAVRGILCGGCNTGIGHLRDDPAVLRDAAAYIESHARRTS